MNNVTIRPANTSGIVSCPAIIQLKATNIPISNQINFALGNKLAIVNREIAVHMI